jgi:general secretion pathway protein D
LTLSLSTGLASCASRDESGPYGVDFMIPAALTSPSRNRAAIQPRGSAGGVPQQAPVFDRGDADGSSQIDLGSSTAPAAAEPIVNADDLIVQAVAKDVLTSWNFRDAPLGDVARAVSRQVNVDIAVPEREAAVPVTFVADKTPLRSSVVELARTLAPQGFVVTRSGKAFEIRRQAKPVGDEQGRTVLRPGNVSVTSLGAVLKQYYPDLDVVVLEHERAVSLSGDPERLADAASVSAAIDSRLTGRGGVALLPLRGASAREVARDAQDLADKSRPAGGIALIALARANAVLAVARNDADLSWISRWISRLDLASRQNAALQSLPIVNRDAAAVAKLIAPLFAAAEPATAEQHAPATAMVPRPASGGAPAADGSAPGAAPVDSESGIAPAVAAPELAAPDAGSTRGLTIAVDAERNALILSGPPQLIAAAERAARALDKASRQIFLQAAIIEVSLGDDMQLGADVLYSGSKVKATASGGRTGPGGTFGVDEALSVLPLARTLGGGLGFLINTSDLKSIITAIQNRSKSRLLSAPRLLVTENEEGEIHVGDKVPILSKQSDSNSVIASGPSIAYVDTGITLKVRPRIASEDVVRLNIEQSAASATITTSSGIDSPTIQQRRLSSTINIASGQTVALGGLIKSSDTVETAGIPLLSDIPVLGAALAGRGERRERSDLLVLLTVRVVDGSEMLGDLTDELKSELNASAARARRTGPTPLRDTFTSPTTH